MPAPFPPDFIGCFHIELPRVTFAVETLPSVLVRERPAKTKSPRFRTKRGACGTAVDGNYRTAKPSSPTVKVSIKPVPFSVTTSVSPSLVNETSAGAVLVPLSALVAPWERKQMAVGKNEAGQRIRAASFAARVEYIWQIAVQREADEALHTRRGRMQNLTGDFFGRCRWHCGKEKVLRGAGRCRKPPLRGIVGHDVGVLPSERRASLGPSPNL